MESKTEAPGATGTSVSIVTTDEGLERAATSDLKMNNVTLLHLGLEITVAELEVSDLAVEQNEDSPIQLIADFALAQSVSCKSSDGTKFYLERVEMHQGLQVMRNGEVVCPSVSLEGLTIKLSPGSSDNSNTDKKQAARFRVDDWDFLDTLSGQLDIDLFLDVRGPIIRRRSETHKFRVGISDGIIDFKRLTKGIHWLERSFLDIEVEPERLVLERDVPLLPIRSKSIMAFPLDPEEYQLAKRNQVRLRTLALGTLTPPEEKRKSKGSSLSLKEVAARNLRLHMGATGPVVISTTHGRFELAAAQSEQCAMKDAEVLGHVQYIPTADGMQATAEVSIAAVRGALKSVMIGHSVLDIGSCEINDISVDVERKAEWNIIGEVSSMAASGIRLTPGVQDSS